MSGISDKSTWDNPVVKAALLKVVVYDNPHLMFLFAEFMRPFVEIEPGIYGMQNDHMRYTQTGILAMFYDQINKK